MSGAARGASKRRWRRRPWGRILAGLLTVAVVGAAVWVVWFSTLLEARSVQVRGLESLTRRQVVVAAQVPPARPLARVDTSAVAQRVRRLPAVASARVFRGWPHAVVVVVRERTPVAVLAGRGHRLVDRSGMVFRRGRSRPPALPVLAAEPDSPAELAEAAAVVAELPRSLVRRVRLVRAPTIDSVTLRLRSGSTVVWGDAGQSARKAEVLAALLRRPAAAYDVSAPSYPTTRG